MSLEHISAKIDQLREQANTEHRQFLDFKAGVESDTRYTSTAKSELIDEERTRLRTRMADLQEQELNVVRERIDALNKSLHRADGSSGADIIALRDAEERADRVENDNEAYRLLERAIHAGDRSLAYAVLRRAVGTGWTRVVDRAAESYPRAVEYINELNELHGFLDGFNAQFVRSMTYTVS
ncbi:hypothetical protein [Microbacterium sp. Marseille-Q6965]|uniref:hypothetical protein n=1 Tax=Microbacterium sp. Marseille-Q6965 TaxID=2965072 RepID=UPI0021B7CB7D|nr:hypothetical protein [Microbacterium sp. Marseille-Q6965]